MSQGTGKFKRERLIKKKGERKYKKIAKRYERRTIYLKDVEEKVIHASRENC